MDLSLDIERILDSVINEQDEMDGDLNSPENNEALHDSHLIIKRYDRFGQPIYSVPR